MKGFEKIKSMARRVRDSSGVLKGESGSVEASEIPGLRMSAVEYLAPESLKPNPLNEYPALEPDEMEELCVDIEKKGILVSLIKKPDGTLLAGHNRQAAALTLNLRLIPVQTVLSPLTVDEELDVMKSENDRRRGGNWSRAKKLDFIRDRFGDRLSDVSRGGDRSSAKGKQSSVNFAREIELSSRGRIPEGTARRLVSEIRKEDVLPDKSVAVEANAGENDLKTPENTVKKAGRKVAAGVRVRDLMGRVKSALADEEPEAGVKK